MRQKPSSHICDCIETTTQIYEYNQDADTNTRVKTVTILTLNTSNSTNLFAQFTISPVSKEKLDLQRTERPCRSDQVKWCQTDRTTL
jgi:hypothetical protein